MFILGLMIGIFIGYFFSTFTLDKMYKYSFERFGEEIRKQYKKHLQNGE